MAKLLLGARREEVKQTRDEVAALLKISTKTLQESKQINDRLRLLIQQIDQELKGKRPVKRKEPK
jgi:hypothetical protein